MVSTFFFFDYGIGQIVNGILCKKYNIKYVVFTCLMVGVATGTFIVYGISAFFAVVNNFVKDGLTAWTPDILSKLYAPPIGSLFTHAPASASCYSRNGFGSKGL